MSGRVEKVRAMLYALTPEERNELLASLAPVPVETPEEEVGLFYQSVIQPSDPRDSGK